MKVRRLYIIGHGYDSDGEARDACTGLFVKYKQRCEQISLFGCSPFREVATEKGDFAGPFQHEVGAYVVFHSMGGMSDSNQSLTPEVLVELLKKVLEEDFMQLGKLVFVACNLAWNKEILRHALGKSVDELKAWDTGVGYIMLVMLKLNDAGITPKLVGWDSYVSVLPHVPEVCKGEKRSIHSDPEPVTGRFKIPESDLNNHIGSKIGRGLTKKQSYGLAKGSFSQEHKRTFWIEDGKVVIDGNSGWSEIK